MKKNYQVISTFDSYHFRRFHEYPEIPAHGCPMRAKDTLLARYLKRPDLSRTPHVRQHERHHQRIKRETPIAWKNARRLIGKALGVEIEFYPSRDTRPRTNLLTSIVDDGSLGDGGQEVRRVTWQNQEGRLAGLYALKLKGVIKKDCGLHVHVDARHLDQYQAADTYRNLCKLYPFLKRLCPASRQRNSYCEWVNNIDECPRRGQRYAAINFESYNEHKTIEFRCQGGSIEPSKIEAWALLCQYLVKWCSSETFVAPANWAGFINALPEPYRSWCILRKQKLTERIQVTERTTCV